MNIFCILGSTLRPLVLFLFWITWPLQGHHSSSCRGLLGAFGPSPIWIGQPEYILLDAKNYMVGPYLTIIALIVWKVCEEFVKLWERMCESVWQSKIQNFSCTHISWDTSNSKNGSILAELWIFCHFPKNISFIHIK